MYVIDRKIEKLIKAGKSDNYIVKKLSEEFEEEHSEDEHNEGFYDEDEQKYYDGNEDDGPDSF